MRCVYVFLADGFEETEALCPVDYLRRCGAEVTVVGVTGLTVVGAHGITVIADCEISNDMAIPDMVILPGGMPGAAHLEKSAAVRTITEKTAAAGGIVAAICAAPAVALAPWGLISNKNFTCYPGMETLVPADTEARYTGGRVTVDGCVITAAGPGAAEEFALTLVSLIAGRETAQRIHAETCCR